MSYALQTLWHERQRYASGVLAVTFSAVLIALQVRAAARAVQDHVHPDRPHPRPTSGSGRQAVPSVDLGKPIPTSYLTRRRRAGRASDARSCTSPTSPTSPSRSGGTELCFLLGSRLDDDAVGAADVLTPEQRAALTEPFTIVVDESDVERLGLDRPDGEAEDQRQGGEAGRHREGAQEPGRPVGVLLAAHRPAPAEVPRPRRPRDVPAGPVRHRRAGPAGGGGTAGRSTPTTCRAYTAEEFSYQIRGLLADPDEGRHRHRVRGAARAAGRGGHHRPDALLGDDGAAPRSSPSCWRSASRGGGSR